MWKKTDRKSVRGKGFLAIERDTPFDEDSSNDSRAKRAKLDPNLISGFMADELDYQFTLAELSVLLGSIKARNGEISGEGISSKVVVCLTSSIAMMHTLSKDIIELLIKMLKLFPNEEDPMMRGKEGNSDSDSSENDIQDEKDEFIERCENIANLLVVYEAFCNNENGIRHRELLPLYINQPQQKNRYSIAIGKASEAQGKSTFSELILYPFLAVDRYQSIFCHLGEVVHRVIPFAEDIRTIQELIRPSRVRVLKISKLVTKLKQIKGLPASLELLPEDREFLKCSPVKKQRAARPSDKERIFYLFSDILVYCTINENFKGFFYCNSLVLRDIPDHPTQFYLTSIKQNSSIRQFDEKIRYTITAESPVEKQDWLQQFHTALSDKGYVRSPKLNRRLRLTTLEETTLNEQSFSFQGSPILNELKDLSECLNSTTVWNSDTRSAVDVSITLLRMITEIYAENRGLLERFGISGFGLISINASFHEFENASAELQRVDLRDMCFEEKIIFWINVYNTISLHSHIKQSSQMKNGIVAFQSNNKYYIGGHIFSLNIIEHGILRAQSHSPSFLLSSRLYPKLKKNDPRSDFVLEEAFPLVNFALNIGSISSPPVVVYVPENWHEQLEQQGKTFCRQQIRIFLHSNQRKVFLPKVLHQYWKDFASSQREMLIYIRDHFLHPAQQQDLSFLDDPASSISIKYDNPEWEFKYPIGRQEMVEEVIPANTVLKEYVLLINQQHVYVRDSLSESPYAFIVPFQLLNIWQAPRRAKLKEFGKSIGKHSVLIHCYERLVNHLDMMSDSAKLYNQYVTRSGDYHGLSFRPSTYKKDSLLQFVALNLQTQLTLISNDKLFDNLISTYTHVTFGAPAAHYYRFKNGNGLRQLRALRDKILEQLEKDYSIDVENELTDIEAQIQMRLDVCVPQVVSALVTAIGRLIDDPPAMSFFQQILHCGLLVQFESLLSTHGSEMGMIGDMDVAVRLLNHFHVQFLPQTDFRSLNPNISMTSDYDFSVDERSSDMQKFGEYLISWQVPFFYDLPSGIQQGELVDIKPVMFTQGINEKQTVAIRLGETKLQERINQENIILLREYYNSWSSFQNFKDNTVNLSSFASQIQRIGEIVENSKCEKNVQILPRTADFVRSVDGIRFTSCKSAKDRTSMSITWEQGRFLHTKAGLPAGTVLKVANDMRSRGVRRENAFRNIGKQKFKFNSFQKSSLPKEYQLRKKDAQKM